MKNVFTPPKTCAGSLAGVDGNAFNILGYYSRCAKAAGWSREDILKVRTEATSKDYDYLVSTIMIHLDD